MKLINADKVIETLRARKNLFCRNRIEFCTLSTDQKARVDEIDTCIAELVNAEEVPHAQLGTNSAEVGTDLISRQALLDKFEPWLNVKDYNDGELNMLKAVLYEIRFMPPAQPKVGKWERHYLRPNVYADLFWHCSECGYRSSDNWAYKFNFCPNCGADMREVTT